MEPTFSIVVITRQRTAELEACLRSIEAIDWNAGDRETIVVEGLAISAAKNSGISRARGKLIAIVGSDYELPVDYLRVAHEFFKGGAGRDVLTFNLQSESRSFFRRTQNLYFELTLRQRVTDTEAAYLTGALLPASRAAVFRREIFDGVGLFDESLAGGEDFDFGRRMNGRGYRIHFLPTTFIRHKEGGLAYYLRQRARYARNTRAASGESLAIWRAPFRVARQYSSWLRLSRRAGLLREFISVTPGLLVFLTTFWMSYCFSGSKRQQLECKVQPI